MSQKMCIWENSHKHFVLVMALSFFAKQLCATSQDPGFMSSPMSRCFIHLPLFSNRRRFSYFLLHPIVSHSLLLPPTHFVHFIVPLPFSLSIWSKSFVHLQFLWKHVISTHKTLHLFAHNYVVRNCFILFTDVHGI